MLRNNLRRAALALVLSIAIQAAPVRADDVPESGDGPRTLLKYLGCAAAVYGGVTNASWVAAFSLCAQLYHDAI